jgi:pimeloyl-ACP methyl ester carboxylesterase
VADVSAARTTYRETPFFADVGSQMLFGILTEPCRTPHGPAVVLLRGGGQGPSSGRNQVSARTCRSLAERGFASVRFDYAGVGESTGEVERFSLARPATNDAIACIQWLRDRGLRRFVLMGGCFGARTALECVDLVDGLEGLILLALPVRDKEKDDIGTRLIVSDRTVWHYARRGFRPRAIRGLFDQRTRRAYARAIRGAWASGSTRAPERDPSTLGISMRVQTGRASHPHPLRSRNVGSELRRLPTGPEWTTRSTRRIGR